LVAVAGLVPHREEEKTKAPLSLEAVEGLGSAVAELSLPGTDLGHPVDPSSGRRHRTTCKP